VHWSHEVQTFAFLGCKELLVRAWDSSQNGQPALITWNLMGMMNNCYQRWGP
jgi:nitrate reductase (NAD(P)H)